MDTNKKEEVLYEQKETLFYCEGGQMPSLDAQKCCGVSIHRDIQKPAGHRPGQPALADCAWAKRLDRMTSRGPFQHQQFCDFMIR